MSKNRNSAIGSVAEQSPSGSNVDATSLGNTNSFDTVVFDFGNVLLRWEPKAAFPQRSEAEVERFFTEFDFETFNHFQDAGRSIADGLAAVRATHPEWEPWITDYLENYPLTILGPMDGMLELVQELKANGIKLYGLTNWWQELYHHAPDTIPAINLMDGVVVSGYEKFAKPDPQIYEILISRFNINPATAVFVDDRQINITAANHLGFHGLLFTAEPALRKTLSGLGLLTK